VIVHRLCAVLVLAVGANVPQISVGLIFLKYQRTRRFVDVVGVADGVGHFGWHAGVTRCAETFERSRRLRWLVGGPYNQYGYQGQRACKYRCCCHRSEQ
jgi:hypothetical protein